jgi:hypothetical protein
VKTGRFPSWKNVNLSTTTAIRLEKAARSWKINEIVL